MFNLNFVPLGSENVHLVSISVRSKAFLHVLRPMNSKVCFERTEHGTFRSILGPCTSIGKPRSWRMSTLMHSQPASTIGTFVGQQVGMKRKSDREREC